MNDMIAIDIMPAPKDRVKGGDERDDGIRILSTSCLAIAAKWFHRAPATNKTS